MAKVFTQRDVDLAERIHKTVATLPRLGFTVIGDLIVVNPLFAGTHTFLEILDQYGVWTVEDSNMRCFVPFETHTLPEVITFFQSQGYELKSLAFV